MHLDRFLAAGHRNGDPRRAPGGRQDPLPEVGDRFPVVHVRQRAPLRGPGRVQFIDDALALHLSAPQRQHHIAEELEIQCIRNGCAVEQAGPYRGIGKMQQDPGDQILDLRLGVSPDLLGGQQGITLNQVRVQRHDHRQAFALRDDGLHFSRVRHVPPAEIGDGLLGVESGQRAMDRADRQVRHLVPDVVTPGQYDPEANDVPVHPGQQIH